MGVKFSILTIVGLIMGSICVLSHAEMTEQENLVLGNKHSKYIVQSEKEAVEMTVRFYRWDRKKQEKEEYLGIAELKDGNLTYEVADPRLEKILKGDFHTMITVEEDGRRENKFVTYKVGTPEHLQSVIDNCKDISCVGEVIEE